MGDFQITVVGLDEAINKLKTLAEKLPNETDAIIEDGAEKMFGDSQQLCPVDTGTLLASGSHTHSFLMSTIGYSAPYAGYVEFGTSRMDAQPYLSPAIEQNVDYIIKRIEQLAHG